MAYPQRKPKEIDILISQYTQCAADHRHYSNLIWQIPSVSFAISGGILGVVFGLKMESLARPFLLGFGIIFTFVLTIALSRYRMFELARRDDMKRIENNLDREGALRIFRDGDSLNKDSWMKKQTAFHWLKGVMWGLFFLLIGGFVVIIFDVLEIINIGPVE